jgi:2'-5' RNA ligase
MTSAAIEGSARVFFALVPPVPLQRALGELARELARRAHGRPVPADNVHITLAFVGAWPQSGLATLCDAGAAIGANALRVTLDTLGGFRRAGVAWIGCSAAPPALGELATTLAARLAASGVALDARPFHPHLTLARKCRGPYPQEAAGPFAWDVDTLTLMQSDTRAEGARYARLASWPLAIAT